jgi:hypothetical protein
MKVSRSLSLCALLTALLGILLYQPAAQAATGKTPGTFQVCAEG